MAAENTLNSLPTNWLNTDNTGTVSTNCVTTTTGNCWTYPNWYYTYNSGRVRLSLSEIERLRKAAKADPKVKDILQKFTDHIELVVDFE